MPSNVSPSAGAVETTTLAGGCFWCLEAVYLRLEGVQSVVSGYMGGHVARPTYRQVCDGNTGHAEVVQIQFDPSVLSYRDLLDVFFTIHDPTTLNRQGNDVGTQYRSAIFYHSEAQKQSAQSVIGELTAAGAFDGRIVTEVTPATVFYRAEDYHQDYFARNAEQPYCQFVVLPKVTKFHKRFPSRVKQSA